MVVAYLRGLLRPQHNFGTRSFATEEVILEALDAECAAASINASVMADLAIIPALTQRGVIATTSRASKRLVRASELRTMDIYKVADQVASRIKRDTKNTLSLYQIYQLAEKSGIFEAFDAHYTADNAKKLL